MKVELFAVNVPRFALDNPREQLILMHRPDEIEGAGWDYCGTYKARKRGGRGFLPNPAWSVNPTDRAVFAESRGQVT